MRYDENVLKAIAYLSLVVGDSRLWPEDQRALERAIYILDGIRHKK